jgi:prepilin-type N-terminal cleavage/methylation domain-containing protein
VNTNVIINKPLVAAFTPQGKKWKTGGMKTKTSRIAGFTLMEIMIVVAIIGLLAAIAIPNFLSARSTSQMNACINNLRQIDSAKQQWALETAQKSTASITVSALQTFLGRGSNGSLKSVYCPLDSTRTYLNSYTTGNMDTPPVCNINGNSATYTHVMLN